MGRWLTVNVDLMSVRNEDRKKKDCGEYDVDVDEGEKKEEKW